MTIKHYTGKLKNNMKYILLKNKCMSSATVMFGVKVGSKNEINKIRGISHFLEHLLFKGTKTRISSRNLSNIVYDHGATFNAGTDYEYTQYYVTIDSKHLLKAIDVLSDMLFYSNFDKEEIEKEKKVVISEHKRYRTEPSSKLDTMVYKMMFKGTNYEYDICGIDEDIKNMTRKSIINYFLYFYRPSNIVLTVCGNYDYTNNNMIKILNKYFGRRLTYYGKIGKSIKYYTRNYVDFYKKQNKFQYVHKKEKHSQAFLKIGFPCFDGFSKYVITLDTIANILGGNMSSRLFIKLREEKGLVYGVSSSYYQYYDMGTMYISCSTYGDEKSILKCVEIIMKEINDLKTNLVKKVELDKSKNFMSGEMVLYLDDSYNLAEYYLDNKLLYNKVEHFSMYKKKVHNQTSKIIRDVSNIVFKKEKCNIGIISGQNISKIKINNIISKYI